MLGGKASPLAQLIRNQYPVPNGFVITPEVPLSSENEILEAVNKQNSKLFAVRSSATIEDGQSKSYAGQFSSFLGIRKEDILEYTEKCRKSLNEKSAQMAVLVQEMIDADFSGVCFSMNPVTNDDSEIICESVQGLGELLVQGEITPSHFQIDKNSLQIKTQYIQAQQKILRLNPDGGTFTLNTKEPESIPLDTCFHELFKLVLEIEKFFKLPIDIEWAMKNNHVYILQARPITTIK